MGKAVGISDYWNTWLEKVVASGIRKSKAEIAEEGLKAIQWRLNSEMNEFIEAREIAKERKEEKLQQIHDELEMKAEEDES